MVHEPIPPKQIRLLPEAAKAVQAEWDKLRDLGAWDLATVREMYDVKAEYKRKGNVAHFGRVFPICHKNTRKRLRVNGSKKAGAFSRETMFIRSPMHTRFSRTSQAVHAIIQ